MNYLMSSSGFQKCAGKQIKTNTVKIKLQRYPTKDRKEYE